MGEGGGIEGGERFEDKRTRVRWLRCLIIWERGEVAARGGGGGGGGCSGNCTPPTCMSPPIVPSRKPCVRLHRVVRPAGTLLSPTLSPQTVPCPQRTLTTNDPKTILKWYWYHFNIILVSFGYRFGIILVSFWYHFGIIGLPVFFTPANLAGRAPPVFFGRGAPGPALTLNQPRPFLPNTQVPASPYLPASV